MSDTKLERLYAVDALRGFALMGLFFVHMVSFYGLHWLDPKPSLSFDIVSWLFGSKSYALFALLFGLSFFIIMDGQSKRGVDFRWRFTWRMGLLALLGFLHSLFYTGDILQVLALSGLVLLVLNGLSNTKLLFAALFFLLHIPTILFVVYLSQNPDLAATNPKFWALTAVSNGVAANGSFAEMLLTNASHSQVGKWWFYLESGRLWNILGFSLLGLWLARVGFFTGFKKYGVAIGAGIVASIVFYILIQYSSSISLNGGLSYWSLGTATYSYLNAALMLTAALIFLRLYQSELGQKVLQHLVPCGRMTLTLYVFQSLIFTPLFFHYGLDLHDALPHDQAVLLAVAFWLGQVWFANTWFRYFQYGPLEWCWRAATYTKLDVPFRVRKA